MVPQLPPPEEQQPAWPTWQEAGPGAEAASSSCTARVAVAAAAEAAPVVGIGTGERPSVVAGVGPLRALAAS